MPNLFRFLALFCCAIAVLVTPQQASAAWYEAQSDNFVIYADDSEKDIAEFARNLERYHSAMEWFTGRKTPTPSPSNRVTIFVVGNQRDLRRIGDFKSRSVAGFYIPRAGASRAFVQDIRNTSNGYPDFSTVILLHEYAHHFFWTSSRFAMPRWMGEGAAEFFASARFDRDGSVSIGLPALHRGRELILGNPMRVSDILTQGQFDRDERSRRDSFYGSSWLLYHYLTFNPQREGQLMAYWRAVVEGQRPLEAGVATFGDLKALDDELDDYLRSRKMTAFKIPADALAPAEIAIRQLPAGEAKIMPTRMAAQRGLDRARALELLPEARAIAAEHPDDAAVLATLAQVEYQAGNDAETVVAADKAIALDRLRANAYVQKGYALFRMAGKSDDPAPAYQAAIEPMLALNAVENDHPIPLIYFYRSFIALGAQPSENARAALEQAARLAPFDQSLALQVAIMFANEGKIGFAKDSLKPLLANPHGGRFADLARSLSAVLELAPEGQAVAIGESQGAYESDADETSDGDDSDDDLGD